MAETKITRENLVEKYRNAVKNLEELKNKKYTYKTSRACQPFAEVSKLSLKDCVQAYATVHDGTRNIENAMSILGITNEDLKSDERKYLGHTVADWDADFKTRVEQIKDAEKKAKYEKVIALFIKNFSDEDRFAIEMAEADSLGIDL